MGVYTVATLIGTDADVSSRYRKTLRLPFYDYSLPGHYFVTACVQGRHAYFGRVADGSMILDDPGRMVASYWKRMGEKYEHIALKEFVVMPNHVHGIIEVLREGGHVGPPLPGVVQWWKTMTTNEYFNGVKKRGWPRCNGRLWQRGYYERVIRNDIECRMIAEYIRTNPMRWAKDVYHV